MNMTLKVASKAAVAQDIYQFELQHMDGGPLPAFTAGAHIPVLTPQGSMRSYSLCNDPEETNRYQIAVKRETGGRGGSISMIDSLQPGDTVEVGQPLNHFPLDPQAQKYILIAGGIGITPLMAMAKTLSRWDKPFKLYYLTRDPKSTPFLNELRAESFAPNLVCHHDAGLPGNNFDLWPVLEKSGSLTGLQLYCCGPAGLMDAVKDMSGHWPSSAVHFESFGVQQTSQVNDTPFTVNFSKSALKVSVPVGTSILQVARSVGIAMPASCESGTCGSCKTRLLEGSADHRDHVLLSEERAQWIMPCVSRALSDHLTLDA
jgi:phthalate 4,5-dioxygenase reductase subunit